MSLTVDFWKIPPASNGNLYSAGAPAPLPTWAPVPNYLGRNTALSVNILSTFIAPYPGCTCVLNGTLPSGWAFNGTLLTYNGTTVNVTATSGLTFTATDTATSATATSNPFSVQGVGVSGVVDNFPRLAGLFGSFPQTYNSYFQTYASNLHFVTFGTVYAAWEQYMGYTRQSIITSIKAQSKINTRCFLFGPSLDQMPFNPSTAGDPVLASKWSAMNWYLYPLGASGTPVYTGDPTATAASVETNPTSASPLDPATGLGPYAWGAKYWNECYRLGLYQSINGNHPCPAADGFHIDNYSWRPHFDGDYLRTGVSTQSQNDKPTQYNWRAGLKTWQTYMLSVWPSGIFMGNIADWWSGNGPGTTSIDPVTGTLNGTLEEHAIGVGNSIDTYIAGGFQEKMRFDMSVLKRPTYLMISHDLTSASGSDNYGPNWQAMRYGLCGTLMNDGYYFANLFANGYGNSDGKGYLLWFDEFSGGGVLNSTTGAVSGGLGVGYLGPPSAGAVGAVQTGPWSGTVWKREFANGIALWNPNALTTNNAGAQTVSLATLGNLKHLSGNQNPSLNNGLPVTSLTLQVRDGVVLLRY